MVILIRGSGFINHGSGLVRAKDVATTPSQS